ncbi:restriction of telomere capping protein 5 [Scheffersomyces xylosifermentans]|uniref:restriction of telomere capping protein 5 n=1 Tax=Scheffersomyces xylosifermentans TaxID=1304137 RepID=UPI00315CD325
MGQTASTDSGSKSDAILESLTKEQVLELFSARCFTLLRKVEVSSLASKLNITDLQEKNMVTQSDLAFLLQLSNDKSKDNSGVSEPFNYALRVLYESTRVLGKFPFISDYGNDRSGGMTVEELLTAVLFHSGRYKKVLPNQYDYLKLIFTSLALPHVESEASESSFEKPEVKETLVSPNTETYVVEVQYPITEEDSPEIRSKKIKWDTFSVIKKFDDIDIDNLKLNANDLLQVITLFLIVSSIPKMKRDIMQKKLAEYIARWHEFEVSALVVLRYINININSSNVKTEYINFKEFKSAIENILPKFFQDSFTILFKEGLLSTVIAKTPNDPTAEKEPDPEPQPELEIETKIASTPTKKKYAFPKFQESKLVNAPSLAIISNLVSNLGIDISISNQNLIKLYAGSESGFSIRSLESKIFKWQAPTLFIVSGKRLKNKTITTNMRYQAFKSEYPQYFRSSESSLRSWQSESDKITYAVLVNLPWRNSNKKNFGDESSLIISLSPKLDYYKSIHNPILKGESIYFNTLGLGLGFGNNQPINRNGIKKYFPGDVSLTIEANLEFAVFRHIVGSTANTATYFDRSHQEQIRSDDFEDRFMISDLEVWGIGSTKELEEQRKQWEWEEKQAEARQSVNLRSLGEERAFLEMVGLVGNHNSSGGSV